MEIVFGAEGGLTSAVYVEEFRGSRLRTFFRVFEGPRGFEKTRWKRAESMIHRDRSCIVYITGGQRYRARTKHNPCT